MNRAQEIKTQLEEAIAGLEALDTEILTGLTIFLGQDTEISLTIGKKADPWLIVDLGDVLKRMLSAHKTYLENNIAEASNDPR